MTAAAERVPGAFARPGAPLRPGGLALTDHALDLACLPPGAVVWDLGCGSGATVRHLAGVRGLRATGVDRSADAIAEARGLDPEGAFVVGSAVALPCPDASLDGVLLECSWSLAEPGFGRVCPDPVLAEAHRVLRPGGALIVTDLCDGPDPHRPRPIGAVPLPTAEELRAAAEDHGFEVTAFEDRTVALRSYVAQILFDGGSLAALLGSERACGPFGAGLAAARPGYFLMVARRGS